MEMRTIKIALLCIGFIVFSDFAWNPSCYASGLESSASSFRNFLDSVTRGEELSSEQISKFVAKQWIDTADEYRIFQGSDFQIKHREKYIMIMYRVSEYGVCSLDILATFTPDGNQIDNVLAGKACDQDQSNPIMYYSDFEVFEDSIIEVQNITERAHGLIGNADEDDAEADDEPDYQVDTIEYNHYVAEASGKFRQIFDTNKYEKGEKQCLLSAHILADSILSALTRNEMQALKDELLARKGYIFAKVEATRTYKKFSWYYPRFRNVSELRFNPIENINLRRIEKLLAK